jgi:hypothetical protein
VRFIGVDTEKLSEVQRRADYPDLTQCKQDHTKFLQFL